MNDRLRAKHIRYARYLDRLIVRAMLHGFYDYSDDLWRRRDRFFRRVGLPAYITE